MKHQKLFDMEPGPCYLMVSWLCFPSFLFLRRIAIAATIATSSISNICYTDEYKMRERRSGIGRKCGFWYLLFTRGTWSVFKILFAAHFSYFLHLASGWSPLWIFLLYDCCCHLSYILYWNTMYFSNRKSSILCFVSFF